MWLIMPILREAARPVVGTFTFAFIIAVLTGCATHHWRSEPEEAVWDTKNLYVVLVPYYDRTPGQFFLHIENKSDQDYTILWNKTFYIEKGETKGGFFRWRDKRTGFIEKPTDIKPKQSDIIFAGETFRDAIVPLALVHLNDGFPGTFGDHWAGDRLGTGEHGIYLTLVPGLGPGELRRKITVNIINDVY